LKNLAGSYHLYAKTGTINSSARTINDDKLLILVVSKGDMTKLSLDAIRKNKFCVMYFSLPKGKKHYYNIYKDALSKLINSESFKNYMRQ